MVGFIHLFKLMGTLNPENVKLKKKDTLAHNRVRLEGSQCDFK